MNRLPAAANSSLRRLPSPPPSAPSELVADFEVSYLYGCFKSWPLAFFTPAQNVRL